MGVLLPTALISVVTLWIKIGLLTKFFFSVYPVFSFNGPRWRSKPQISASFQFLLCFGSDCSSKYMCKVGTWPSSPPTRLQQAQHPPSQPKRQGVVPLSSLPVGAGLLIEKEKKNRKLQELQEEALGNPVRLKVGHLVERFLFPLTVNEMKTQEDSMAITAYDGNVVLVQWCTELVRTASCSEEAASLCMSKCIPWLCGTPTCPWHHHSLWFFCFFSALSIDWRGHREQILLQP